MGINWWCIIDEIIREPVGGAHRDKYKILENVRNSIIKNLEYYKNLSNDEIVQQRKNKFLQIGRESGFSTKPEISNNMSLKKSDFTNFIEKFSKQKKILSGGILLFLLIAGLFYLL